MVVDAGHLIQFIDQRLPALMPKELSDVHLAGRLGTSWGRILRRYADQIADDFYKPIPVLIYVIS
jgi:hypothetical protein